MKGPRFGVLLVSIFALCFVLFATKPWTVAGLAAEREAAGLRSLLDHDIARGLWFGFLGTAIAGFTLTALWKRWCQGLSTPRVTATIPAEGMGRPLFCALLLGAVLVGGWVKWGFAHRGLWWDELWSVRNASLGYLKPVDDDAKLRFLKRDWKTTIWEYRKPTNHAQASIASRVSQSIWRKATGAEAHAFDAFAVRLPSFLAGLLSVAAIGVLVRRWGFSIGGLASAFLLALHPWYMRYGTEARGYSFAVLWTILGCLWLTYAVSDERGRLRFWLLFGLNQVLITWCLPNGFYYATAFFAAALFFVFRRWRSHGSRANAVWRLLAVNVMAAMVFLPLFMPNVLQAMRWGEIHDTATLTIPRLMDALSHLAFGMPMEATPGEEGAGIPALRLEANSTPMGIWPTACLLGVGLVTGAVRLSRTRPGAAIALAAIVAAAAASLLVTKLAGHFFYHRYIIYTIVPFVVLFGIGLAGFSRAITKRAGAAAFIGIASLGLYLYTTRAPRALLFTRPYAPFEEVAEHLKVQAAEDPELHVIGYGLGGRMLAMYYPKTRFAKNKTDLSREIAAAQTSRAAYLVVLGYESVNRVLPEYRDGFEILDSYTQSRSFAGIDPLFYFKILHPPVVPRGPVPD